MKRSSALNIKPTQEKARAKPRFFRKTTSPESRRCLSVRVVAWPNSRRRQTALSWAPRRICTWVAYRAQSTGRLLCGISGCSPTRPRRRLAGACRTSCASAASARKRPAILILSKNVPTPELYCRFAKTGRLVMRIPMRAISNRVLEFVML